MDVVDILLRPYGIDIKTTLEQAAGKEGPAWLPLNAAAKSAGISRWTLRRLIASGAINAAKSSPSRCGRIIVSKQSLEKFLASRLISPQNPNN